MTPQRTPAGNPLALPPSLAEAIAAEWEGKKAFNAAAMPLTALAYTAIDRVEGDKENIVQVLLAYVDTDTLCYRNSGIGDRGSGAGKKTLAQLQKEQWDPILAWVGAKFSALWLTTGGIMPLEQPQALHQALENYLMALDSMRLTACMMLASHYSSIVLALAVVEGRLAAEEAFSLSRLEERFQAEAWGEDEAAQARQANILQEIKSVARFLALLERA